ncbi:hypothetical protein SUGI_0698910 [Cryptomeria japonica]|nr:hypothetical protein SUGI_0698910 [Cryptomeria japonica]
MWDELFERIEDREYVMSVYEAHVEAVKNYVPANKLLVFNVKEGWSPLCDFLGVPAPPIHTPFPHSNDTAEYSEHLGGSKDFNLREAQMDPVINTSLPPPSLWSLTDFEISGEASSDRCIAAPLEEGPLGLALNLVGRNKSECGSSQKIRGRISNSELRLMDGKALDQSKLTDVFNVGRGKFPPTLQ